MEQNQQVNHPHSYIPNFPVANSDYHQYPMNTGINNYQQFEQVYKQRLINGNEILQIPYTLPNNYNYNNKISNSKKKIKYDMNRINKVLDTFKNICKNGNQSQKETDYQDDLQLVLQYKESSNQMIISEDIHQNNSQSQITPLIFTKKQSQLNRNSKNLPQFLIAFENYLSIVAMLYYKKNFNIQELLIIPEQPKETVSKTIGLEKQQPKKETKPGRKAKNQKSQDNNDEYKRGRGRWGKKGHEQKKEEELHVENDENAQQKIVSEQNVPDETNQIQEQQGELQTQQQVHQSTLIVNSQQGESQASLLKISLTNIKDETTQGQIFDGHIISGMQSGQTITQNQAQLLQSQGSQTKIEVIKDEQNTQSQSQIKAEDQQSHSDNQLIDTKNIQGQTLQVPLNPMLQTVGGGRIINPNQLQNIVNINLQQQPKQQQQIQQQIQNNINNQQQKSMQNNLTQSIFDSIISPLRVEYVFESWTPKEIAIFEAGICRFGKQFGFISEIIKTKTVENVFDFYCYWKLTSHYKIWKLHKSISNRNNYSSFI